MPPATLEISDNRLVFYLPFRLPGASRQTDPNATPLPACTRLAKALRGLNDGPLLQRWVATQLPEPLWHQQDAAEASEALSSELYPVASRILFGDPTDSDSGHPPLRAIAHGAGRHRQRLGQAEAQTNHAEWLRAAPLHLVCEGQWLQLQFQGATVRIFGSGLGLLGLTLRLVDAASPNDALPAGLLLKALHTLTQSDDRGHTPLAARGRWHWRDIPAPAAVGTLFIEQAGQLAPLQISGYEKACRKAGGVVPLWRCVAVRPLPGPPVAPTAGATVGLPAGAQPGAGTTALPAATHQLLLEALEPSLAKLMLPAGATATPVSKGQQFKRASRRAAASAAAAASPASGLTPPAPGQPNGAVGPELGEPIAVVAQTDPGGDGDHLQAMDNGANAADTGAGQPGQPPAVLQALHDAKPGEPFWAHRLPPDFSLIDLLLDFLPPQALPGREPQTAVHEPVRWHPFSYAAARLDDPSGLAISPEACRDLAFRLARRFDLSYRPSAHDVADACTAPFETVFHSVATQGAAVVVRADETEFLQHFLSRAFHTAYRPIAEVCLHEYALLLDLVQDSAFMPRQRPVQQDIERLEYLGYALAQYRLFYRFSKISHMAHHNTVLALWRRALGLDVMLAEVDQDVHQVHRLLDSDQARRETQRWSLFTAIGLAMAAFLSTSEVADRLAQARCPPEALTIAATDLQVHGAPSGLLEILPAIRQRYPAQPGEDWMPLLDRLCMDGQAMPARPPGASLPPAAQLAEQLAAAAPSDQASAPPHTMAEALQGFCSATAEVRQCARRASTVRQTGFWAATGAAALSFGLALAFLPGGLGARLWQRVRQRLGMA